MKKTMEKILAAFLVAVMILSAAPLGGIGSVIVPKASAAGATGQCGDNAYWSLNDGVLTISGTGAMWNYYEGESTVPYDKASIKEIVFEDGVTSIGIGAFSSCENLESVDLGSVESIGEYAFAYCTGLKNVEFPDNELEIGISAFEGCAELDNVEFNNSVYLHSYAFMSCSSLTEIEIPEGSTVGELDWEESGIFFECTSLKKAVINGQIGNAQGLFINCSSLTDLEINTHYSLSWETFNGCTSLNLNLDEQDVDLSITSSGHSSLESVCGNVCNVIYSGNITSAPWGARTLNGYVNDEGLVFSDDTMTKLTACPSCTRGEIFIPGSVAEIAAYAFVGCEELTDIYFDGTEAEWDEISISSEGNSALFNAEIHFLEVMSGECGDNLTWSFDEATGTLTISGTGDMWNYRVEKSPFAFLPIETVAIENGVTGIGNNAFNPCEGIISVTIPDGVTRIGDSAFGLCASLTNIELPDSVTSIGEYAFTCCESLTSIEIPYGVTSISDNAFFCAGLTSVTIPDSVTSIGDYAFASCSFENVIIPDSVTDIGNFAFNDCGSLKSITIGSGVTYIASYAFDDCTELTDVYYNGNPSGYYSGMLYIDYEGNDPLFDAEIHFIMAASGQCGDNVFWSFDESTGTLTISGTGDIWDYYDDQHSDRPSSYFEYNSAIKSVIIKNGITRIGDGLFYMCSGISSVTVPASVSEIGAFTFGCCTALKSFEIPSGVESIGSYTFVSCRSLESIIIPKSLTCIYDNTFWMCDSLTDVYYKGSQSEWNDIFVDEYNEELLGANIHYYYPCAHNFVFESNGTAPDCTHAGTAIYRCSVCGDTKTEAVPALGHSYEWVVSVNPTATSKGLMVNKCVRCGDICDQTEIPCLIPDYVTGLTLSSEKEIMNLGDTLTLTAEVIPDSAKNKNVVWKSLDADIASVADGVVTALKAGSTVISAQTEDGGYKDFCYVRIVGIVPSANTATVIDNERNLIYGLDVNAESIEDFIDVADESVSVVCSTASVGTGTQVNLVRNGEIIDTYETVIFGDTNGDGWYDGMDAVKVSCIANDMLSKEQVGEAAYMAADCNHDGVIDQLDVEILRQAGVLLEEVDQTKSEEELLETSAYVEYLNLISQTVEEETTEVIEDEPVNPVTNPLSKIISVIKDLVAIIKAAVAFIKADMPGLPFSFKK